MLVSFVAVSLLMSAILVLQSNPAYSPSPVGSKAYTPHAAIVIASDADFSTQGWPGSGSVANPYLIAGLEIDGLAFQSGIFISNTSKHYIIQGCYIYNSWQAGVFLYNAPDGEILDCLLSDNEPFGIRISSCSGMSVVNNTCAGASEAGISVSQTPGTIVTNNTCSNNGEDGITVTYSDDCTISGNICLGNSDHGILAWGSNNIVTENTCNDNYYWGIEVCYGSGLLVAENHCGECNLLLNHVTDSVVSRNAIVGRGIEAWGSRHNDINNNSCLYPGGYGISLSGSSLLGDSPENLIADNNCSGCGSGIKIWPTSYDGGTSNISGANTLARNDCTNCTTGIYLYVTDYAALVENNCSDSTVGIKLEQSHWTSITGNRLERSSSAAVIILESTYATLRDNQMVSAGISIVGDTAPEWALQDIDTSNTVNGVPVCYVRGALSGQTLSGYGQVIVAASKNFEVRGQTIDNASIAVAVGFCTNVTVADSSCTNNSLQGILFEYSEGCTATNNSCRWNPDGIKLENSESCLVSNNTCSNNTHSGIMVLGDSYNSFFGNNTIRNNSCSHNLDGILVQWSQYNLIHHNLLVWNSRNGVYLSSPSPWRMPYPIYTQFNLVWGNTFMANNGGGVQAADGGDNNWWNLTSSGNYWDDHQTPDDNGDGIVDVPYPIAGGSYDYYPLTSYPSSPIPEMNAVGLVTAAIITGLVLCLWSRRRR